MVEQQSGATPKKPKNLKALILGLLVALAGAGGADAAGYQPDLDSLKALGIVGAAVLIAYLEYRLMPVANRIADGLDRAYPAPATAASEDAVTEPVRRETKPRMAVVRPKESGFISPRILVWLFGVTVFAMLTACGWFRSEANHAAGTTVDCATARARDAIRQFGPTLEQVIVSTVDAAGKADWNTIRTATEDYAADVGGCVMQATITRLLEEAQRAGAPASSPLDIDKADLAHEWDELRLQRYGGAAFKGAQ